MWKKKKLHVFTDGILAFCLERLQWSLKLGTGKDQRERLNTFNFIANFQNGSYFFWTVSMSVKTIRKNQQRNDWQLGTQVTRWEFFWSFFHLPISKWQGVQESPTNNSGHLCRYNENSGQTSDVLIMKEIASLIILFIVVLHKLILLIQYFLFNITILLY